MTRGPIRDIAFMYLSLAGERFLPCAPYVHASTQTHSNQLNMESVPGMNGMNGSLSLLCAAVEEVATEPEDLDGCEGLILGSSLKNNFLKIGEWEVGQQLAPSGRDPCVQATAVLLGAQAKVLGPTYRHGEHLQGDANLFQLLLVGLCVCVRPLPFSLGAIVPECALTLNRWGFAGCAGQALVNINDKKLYKKAGASSFTQYIEQKAEFGFGPRQALRLLAATRLVRSFPPTVAVPTSERQVRQRAEPAAPERTVSAWSFVSHGPTGHLNRSLGFAGWRKQLHSGLDDWLIRKQEALASLWPYPWPVSAGTLFIHTAHPL